MCINNKCIKIIKQRKNYNIINAQNKINIKI